MVLFEDEFIKDFTGGEIKKIVVKIRDIDKDIYIRRLSGFVSTSLRKRINQTMQRGTLDAIIGVVNKSDYNLRDDDAEAVEFFLLRQSICNIDGGLIFTEDNTDFFEKFIKAVDGDVMDFIISEISLFNNIHSEKEISDINKEVKKK